MNERGQSLVESALILATFMGLLLGMTGIGEQIFVRQTLADRAAPGSSLGRAECFRSGTDSREGPVRRRRCCRHRSLEPRMPGPGLPHPRRDPLARHSRR